MASANDRNRTITPDLDAAAERVRQANDRFANARVKATAAYLDGVERYVTGLTRAERKLGGQSQFEAVGQLLNAHADFTDDVVKASVSAARELIAA